MSDEWELCYETSPLFSLQRTSKPRDNPLYRRKVDHPSQADTRLTEGGHTHSGGSLRPKHQGCKDICVDGCSVMLWYLNTASSIVIIGRTVTKGRGRVEFE